MSPMAPIASKPPTITTTGPRGCADNATDVVAAASGPSVGSTMATAGATDPLAEAVCTGLGVASGVVGLGLGLGLGLVEAAGAAAATTLGTGWIDTYRPSQTIFLGAYFHGVKKRLSCAVVSFVFGAMS